jgi:hypothetical protein
MAVTQVKALVKALTMGRDRFVYGLEKTPDDRLAWSPGSEARTPLQLAGTVAGFIGFMTHITREGTMPERTGEQPPAPETREAAQAAVAGSLNAAIAAVESLSEADLLKQVPVPWGGTIPCGEFIRFLPSVLNYFQGQLNYLQTIYGDKDPNMPPSWREGQGE